MIPSKFQRLLLRAGGAQIINKVCFKLWGCMKGLQPLQMKSAAATCAVRGAAASRFLYHLLAVRAAYKKMMFYPLQVCVSRLAATDRQQYFVDGLSASCFVREALLCIWVYLPFQNAAVVIPSGHGYALSASCHVSSLMLVSPLDLLRALAALTNGTM